MMRAFNPMKRAPLVAAMLLAIGPSTLMANDIGFVIEEIIVTAQKRAQSLQDVPLSVSAFGGDFIEQAGSANLVDLAKFTPGLNADNPARGFGVISMRGVSSNDFGVGGDPSVGVYVDGVYVGRGGSAVSDFLDVAQVEILKGPQGTLFGRNTAGGAISITTHQPGNEFDASVGASVGSAGYRELRAMVNLPLIDESLSLRTSIKTKRQDGWMDNAINSDESGEVDNSSGRLSLLWTPSDTISVTFTNDWERTDDEAMLSNELIAMDPATITSGAVTGIFQDVQALNAALGANVFHADTFNLGDKKYSSNVSPGSFDRRQRGHSVKVEWDVTDSLTLTSLTAYREFDLAYSEDVDGSELDIFQIEESAQGQETYSQEFRLNGHAEGVDWFVGLSFFKEDIFSRDTADFPSFGLTNIIYGAQAKTESYALFSDVIWMLTDTLNLTTGLRYSYDAKTHKVIGDKTPLGSGGAADLNFAFGGAVLPVFDDHQHENWEDVSPRLVLDYSLADDILLYASATKGYKSGGFNSSAATIEEPAFGSENINSFEVGLKSSWLSDRVRVNAALFQFDYEDLQVLTQDGLGFVIKNAGKASASGLETDITFAVTEDLILTASAGWLNAEYDKFDDGGVSRAGEDLVRSPHFSGAVGVDYLLGLEGRGTLRFNASYSYVGDQIYSHSLGELGEEGSYGLLGARVTYISPDESLSISLYGDNLADEEYLSERGNSGTGLGFYNGRRGNPLMWGVSLDYSFE